MSFVITAPLWPLFLSRSKTVDPGLLLRHCLAHHC